MSLFFSQIQSTESNNVKYQYQVRWDIILIHLRSLKPPNIPSLLIRVLHHARSLVRCVPPVQDNPRFTDVPPRSFATNTFSTPLNSFFHSFGVCLVLGLRYRFHCTLFQVFIDKIDNYFRKKSRL